MTDREWLERFAGAIGVTPPSDEEHELLLKLAAEAAHSSERTAAPAACWLAARSGHALTELVETAARVGGAPSE